MPRKAVVSDCMGSQAIVKQWSNDCHKQLFWNLPGPVLPPSFPRSTSPGPSIVHIVSSGRNLTEVQRLLIQAVTRFAIESKPVPPGSKSCGKDGGKKQ